MRVGIGFDVHRLAPGRRLHIGGVEIPFRLGLEGHSDADVALHALMDAILGASSLGDIGELFPDTDDAYRDANSLGLLTRVVGLARGKGFRIGGVDIVVICEEPKISVFREEMREKIARVCDVGVERVSIKGKTAEGLGFVGRGEGIASIAVALLEEGQSAGNQSKS